MSDMLRVTLDGLRLDPVGEADLNDLYRTAATAAVPPSMVSSIRLVFRSELHGTTIEPFLGSASFEALLRIAKKRGDATALLSTLVGCALCVCQSVGVVLMREGSALPHERTDLCFKALREQRLSKNAWYRILAPLTWFHFAQVEAKLLEPLKLRSGELASHYFREFWVRAIERPIACDAVTMMVTKDGGMVVDFGEVVPDDAPPSPHRTGDNVIARGRIYFCDRGH